MSVTRNALKGIAWAAGANWLQLGLSAATFALVVSKLTPTEIGLYGTAALATGLVSALFGGPLNESLEQREDLRPEHVNATFWVGLILCSLCALALALLARPVASLLGAPDAGRLMVWLAAALPLGAATGVMRALMVRNQRFGEASGIGSLARLVSGAASITAMIMGAGVWALLIGDLVVQAVEFLLFARASGFRPGRPQRLGAIGDLLRFNLHTLATYALSYLDGVLPRVIASTMLGPQAFGYLIIAGRVFGQVSQLVLAPLGAVTMTSVARVQSDRAELHKLISGLYQLAALVAYPAFLGAVVIMPPLAALAGDKWLPAVLITQIMLLVGLRSATGAFNFGILRGVGDTTAPLLLLAAGVAAQLIVVPVGVQFGAVGVAAAALARSYLTWPLGCWMLQRATGFRIRDQLALGRPALVAALLMAAAVWAGLQGLDGAEPLVQLVAAGGIGLVVYPLALAIVFPRVRRLMGSAVRAVFSRRPAHLAQNLKAEFGL